jgi:hypothetical protein
MPERVEPRMFLAHVVHTAWRAAGGRSGVLPRQLTLEIDRVAHDRNREPALDVTRIPRGELRAVVEHVTSTGAGALARLATKLAIDAAGGRGSLIAAAGSELGSALQMLEDLRATADVDGARASVWELRPSWAWVWTSEAADAASWVRGVRWAQQVAARRSDPLPVTHFLGQFANRRGAAEARARLDAACDAIRRGVEADA